MVVFVPSPISPRSSRETEWLVVASLEIPSSLLIRFSKTWDRNWAPLSIMGVPSNILLFLLFYIQFYDLLSVLLICICKLLTGYCNNSPRYRRIKRNILKWKMVFFNLIFYKLNKWDNFIENFLFLSIFILIILNNIVFNISVMLLQYYRIISIRNTLWIYDQNEWFIKFIITYKCSTIMLKIIEIQAIKSWLSFLN